jgi:uncharacterized membrane protein YkvA (DUF1232 family)
MEDKTKKTEAQITEAQIIEELNKKAEVYDEHKVDEVIAHEIDISKKSKKLDYDKFSKLINQIKLALEMIKDFRAKKYREVPWKSIMLLAFVLMYFLSPFDLIPDFLPVLGFTDDALAFAGVFKSLQSDLKKYCMWKGYDLEKYF